jgi:3-hydroxybutyryl-CoA dehydratase
MNSPLSLPADDLEVGGRFATRGRTVTEADVVSFAALTGDRHPQHVDADWAAQSAFGERVAHGMLVLSYAVGLVPLEPDRVLALRRVEDAVFKRPARLGDTIHVEGRIDRVTPIDAEVCLVKTTWRVVNQDGAAVARVGAEVLWRRRAAPGPGAHEAEASRADGAAAVAAAEPLVVPL